MMKMHGLGDFAYYSVQYVWYMCLYIVYIIILLAVGSAVNIGFFRHNGYGLQIVRLCCSSPPCGCCSIASARWVDSCSEQVVHDMSDICACCMTAVLFCLGKLHGQPGLHDVYVLQQHAYGSRCRCTS